jgi:hypothetical protein
MQRRGATVAEEAAAGILIMEVAVVLEAEAEAEVEESMKH